MYPTLLQILDIKIPSYFVFSFLGYFCAVILATYLAKREGMRLVEIFDFGIIIIISALLGSKLGHCLFEATNHKTSDGKMVTGVVDLFSRDPWHLFRFSEGGYVWYGGLIVAVIVSMIYLKRKNLDKWPMLDLYAPMVMLGLAIGRIGCFLAGCCFGIPTQIPLGVIFPNSPPDLQGVHLHPVQLYSSLNATLIFFFLLWFRKRQNYPGQTFALLLIIYPVTRFFLEFLRGDIQRGIHLNGLLSTSQVISLLLLPIGGICYYYLYRIEKIRREEYRKRKGQ